MKKDYENPQVEFIILSKNDLFMTSEASECTCYDDYDAVCEAPRFCLDV